MQYFTLAFKRWNDIEGTSTRKEYWMYVLISILVWLILGLIGMLLDSIPGVSDTVSVLIGVVILITLVPGISLGIRRLHDAGFSGWWLVLNIIPYIGSFILIFFYIQKTKTVGNKYAPMVMTPMPPVMPM